MRHDDVDLSYAERLDFAAISASITVDGDTLRNHRYIVLTLVAVVAWIYSAVLGTPLTGYLFWVALVAGVAAAYTAPNERSWAERVSGHFNGVFYDGDGF